MTLGSRFWRFMEATPKIAKYIPYLYVIFAAPAIFFQVFYTPPFQTPDSYANFNQADIFERCIDDRVCLKNGADIEFDPNLLRVEEYFSKAAKSYSGEDIGDNYSSIKQVGWSGKEKLASYRVGQIPLTLVYPWPGFTPQIAALWIGRYFGLTIIDTYRLCVGLIAVLSLAIMFFALRAARRFRPIIYFIGILPMTGMLFSAVEVDFYLISLSALFFALIDKALAENRCSLPAMLLMGGLAFFVALEKLPYLPILFFIFLPGIRWGDGQGYYLGRRVVFVLLVSFGVALWWIHMAPFIQMANPGGSVAPAHAFGQGAFEDRVNFTLNVMSHLPEFFIAVLATIKAYRVAYIESFLGVLGWLDIVLRPNFYLIGEIFFIGAVIVAGRRLSVVDRAIAICVGMILFLAIFGTFYLSYGLNSSRIIDNIQGRYFLPIIFSVPFLFPDVAGYMRSSGVAHKAVLILRSLFLAALYFGAPVAFGMYTVDALKNRFRCFGSVVIGQSPGSTNQTALALPPGSEIRGALVAKGLQKPEQVHQVGVLIGTYFGLADGKLEVSLCNRGQCSTGAGNLGEAADNSQFWMKLKAPLVVHPNDVVSFAFYHVSGSHAVAFWAGTTKDGSPTQGLLLNSTPIGAYALKLQLCGAPKH